MLGKHGITKSGAIPINMRPAQKSLDQHTGGDNSYPGFVELSPTRGLVSWYSSHEKDDSGKTMTAIYLADLEIAE